MWHPGSGGVSVRDTGERNNMNRNVHRLARSGRRVAVRVVATLLLASSHSKPGEPLDANDRGDDGRIVGRHNELVADLEQLQHTEPCRQCAGNKRQGTGIANAFAQANAQGAV